MQLHPGVNVALRRLTMHELDIAKAIRDGELTSPQVYENVFLIAIRITGTGAAYRPQHNEYVWRDPAAFLTTEFLERCNGLTTIWIHPETNQLNSEEFRERAVGSIFLTYIKGDEVWGIAKIYDDDARRALETDEISTSPGIKIGDLSYKKTMPDGSTLLVEDNPSLVDHIAFVSKGVWDKGGDPAGVEQTLMYGDSAVSEEVKKDASDDKKDASMETMPVDKKDADAGQQPDKMLSYLDSMMKRMDAMCARMDAWDEDKSKKDAAEDKKDKKDGDPDPKASDPEPVVADKKDAAEDKKDAEDEKAKKDAAEKMKADSAALTARLDALERYTSGEDDEEMVRARTVVEEIAHAFSLRAPKPLSGEKAHNYARRAIAPYQKHSKEWGDVDLATLPPKVLTKVVDAIRVDSINAARSAADVPMGQMRMISNVDPSTGQRTNTFHGQTTIFKQFTAPSRRATGTFRDQSKTI